MPITWGEAYSFLSDKLGTRRQTAGAAVATERRNLQRLRWSWTDELHAKDRELDRRFRAGDVYRFRGLDVDGRTALVGQV